eukprot:scaffold254342_cov17-Tisochrysis_lutea.AAC.1
MSELTPELGERSHLLGTHHDLLIHQLPSLAAGKAYISESGLNPDILLYQNQRRKELDFELPAIYTST